MYKLYYPSRIHCFFRTPTVDTEKYFLLSGCRGHVVLSTEKKLICPEILLESKAKSDNFIFVQRTNAVKNREDAYNFNACVALGVKWLWVNFYTGKEAKGLDNRYCVKSMQFGRCLSDEKYP